jgi:hypothetical protein
MPSGDAQRVWFPEMIEELKGAWSKAMTWEDLAYFCARMTDKRKEIRVDIGIHPPRERASPPPPGRQCPRCGQMSRPYRANPVGVSIRSALFALKNSGVITDTEFKSLDKSWMKHKVEHSLDLYGREVEPVHSETDLTILAEGKRNL